jgi:hypothetical protein
MAKANMGLDPTMKSLPKWLAEWPGKIRRAIWLLTLDREPPDTRDWATRYEPTAEDWAEYSRWSDALTSRRPTPDPHAEPWGDFCPADHGDPCPSCDRAQAEAQALEHDAEADSDGWYMDLCARADFRHDPYRDGGDW